MKKTVGGWRNRVQEVYSSLEELEAYDRVYNIAQRCGIKSAKALWDANPLLRGSTNPDDLGIVGEPKGRVT